MILGCRCWEMTSCCVAFLFVCIRLHCGSLLVGLKKNISQNWQVIAFWIVLSLLIFFKQKLLKWNISENLALACNFSLAIFEVHFGGRDDGYNLRMMILGCRFWEMTSCCVTFLFVCNRLHCRSLLVGLKKKISQNWQFIAFSIALSLLIFFKQNYKIEYPSEVLALACNFAFTIFHDLFGVQDDGYYLRMMILGCRCWEMTSCCVAFLFVCNRLHCGSLLVGLKKNISQNWQIIAFWIALSLLMFFKQKI